MRHATLPTHVIDVCLIDVCLRILGFAALIFAAGQDLIEKKADSHAL